MLVEGSPRVASRQVIVFFLLAFAVTWIVWVPRAMVTQDLFESDLIVALGSAWTYGPAIAALIAASMMDGRRGLRDLGSRLARWRVGWIWYVVVLLGPLVLSLAGAAVNVAIGGSWSESIPSFEGGIGGVVLLLVILCLTDGLGEETGWRGYALPRLLLVTGAVPASIILGVVWAAWHLPLFWTVGSPLEATSILALFLRLPATSIMFTWVFQHTRGSLLLAILFHGALNVWAVAPPTDGSLQGPMVGVATHWLVAAALIPAIRSQEASPSANLRQPPP